jgi:hypothetical protein
MKTDPAKARVLVSCRGLGHLAKSGFLLYYNFD